MFALQVDYKRASDRHTSAYVAPRHSHDGKFSVSLCADHGLGVATRRVCRGYGAGSTLKKSSENTVFPFFAARDSRFLLSDGRERVAAAADTGLHHGCC